MKYLPGDTTVYTRQIVILMVAMFVVLLCNNVTEAGVKKPIGVVSSLTGNVSVKHWGQTEWVSLKLGSDMYQYDVIDTGDNSKVRVTFEDGSLLNLSENTRLQIREHVYTPQENRRTSLFSLMKGKMRVLCQKFAGRGSRFNVRTPTAVIGIRGTEFIVWTVNDDVTTVVCVENSVSVKNIDEAVAGEVILESKQMTTVGKGVPPLPPSLAPDVLRKQLDIDTAAYRIPPTLAAPAQMQIAPAVEALERAAHQGPPPPPVPKPQHLPIKPSDRVPELPPIPQEPGDVNRPPLLPGPPPPPGQQ